MALEHTKSKDIEQTRTMYRKREEVIKLSTICAPLLPPPLLCTATAAAAADMPTAAAT